MSRLEKLLEEQNQRLSEARQIVDKPTADAEDQENYERALEAFRHVSKLVEDEKTFRAVEAANVEARAQFEDIVPQHESRKADDARLAEFREFVTPQSERKSLWIPMPEARTTGSIVTDDGGATAYGSYTNPTNWWNQVYMHVNAESGVLASGCTVIRTNDGNQLKIPTLATDATAAQTAQATAATETVPVFGQKVLDAYRMDGYFTVSKEFMEDTAIDSLGFLQNAAGRAIATLVASYAASGDGSGNPQGLNYTTEPTTAGKTAAAATTFTSDEIMDLYLSVAPSSRRRGEFVAGTTAYGIMLKWKDDEGRYLVTNPTATENATFMGRPIREDADYQATTTGLVPVTFGDMSAFWVRWARGMEFTRDDSFQFTSFASTFRFAVWFDCELLDTLAVKHLLMG